MNLHAPYDDYQTVGQFIADQQYATEREWSDVLHAATREADRKTACLIETDSLDIDHDRQQVTFQWTAHIESTEPRDLAKALECAAVAIKKAVAMVRDARFRLEGGAP